MIRFSDHNHFSFVSAFAGRWEPFGYAVKIREAERQVGCRDGRLETLLDRLASASSAVLPSLGSEEDNWLLIAPDSRALERLAAHIGTYLVPSYALFNNWGNQESYPVRQYFEPEKHPVHRLGARLYPHGYCLVRSDPRDRERIIDRLALWAAVESRRPAQRVEHAPSYRELHAAFDAALVASNFEEAQALIEGIQRRYLTTATNIRFLELRVLGERRQWSEIWARGDYPLLAQLHVPPPVRSVLLTAFHHSVLLPIEHERRYADGVKALRECREKLGRLLNSRSGLSTAPVLRVFAYQAVLDQSRDALLRLREEARDVETWRTIDALLDMLPPEAEAVAPTALAQAEAALTDHNFDDAWRLSEGVQDAVARALLRLNIAFDSKDGDFALQVLADCEDLTATEKEQLHSHRHVPAYLHSLEEMAFAQPEGPQLETWSEWLAYATAHPDADGLRDSVETLLGSAARSTWTPETVRSAYPHLFELLTSPWFVSFSAAQRVVCGLATDVMSSPTFPEESPEHLDFYGALLEGMTTVGRPNETDTALIVRLADAILRSDPAKAGDIHAVLDEWFAPPIPRLAPLVLESFEVLAETGLDGWRLQPLYQQWLVALLEQPTARARADLDLWLSFGHWIKANPNLLAKAEQLLGGKAADEGDNPIAALPPKFQIVIFMLRKSTADRVRQALLARNSDLDVRICLEKAMNDQVAALARNADMAVVVTTCITHAITYGIEPLLANDPVYPQSSGSTSILAKIEEVSGTKATA